jgi:dTDP-4-amino-4,6-dideoxygalactose transaminase
MVKGGGHNIRYVDLGAQAEDQLPDLMPILEQVLLKGEFVGGNAVVEFEQQISDYLGCAEAVALNSGTDALILAMQVAGIGPGDEVITPPNSFVASAAAIVMVGAQPVFADVLPDQNIDPECIEAAITLRTKAIMPVHLTGRVCRMDAIMDIAERHGLIVVEDAAQAIGSLYQGRQCGTFGTFGCFSAHPLKNLNALGDSGFLSTDDVEAATVVRRLRNHGLSDRVTVNEWGRVSRMDTLQAVILNYRLKILPDVIERRRANAMRYRAILADERIFIPPCRDEEYNTFHTFVIQVDRRDELQAYLKARGIRTTIHYPVPIHLQPAARSLGYGPGDFPVTEQQAQRILTLPVSQNTSPEDVEVVAGEILAFLG